MIVKALGQERVQRALERAQAAPKTQIGRRPIRRSEPPRIKARARQTTEQLTMEQQEYRFYFEYWASFYTLIVLYMLYFRNNKLFFYIKLQKV